MPLFEDKIYIFIFLIESSDPKVLYLPFNDLTIVTIKSKSSSKYISLIYKILSQFLV